MSVANYLVDALASAPQPVVQWQGASGAWHLHSVFSINAIPTWIGPCNYIFTAPRSDGLRTPLYIGESGDFDARLGQHEKLNSVLLLGGTEVHVHFGARSRQERLYIETDLRRGQPTPLNRQSSGIPQISGLSGLFALSALTNPPNALGLAADFITPPVNALSFLR